MIKKSLRAYITCGQLVFFILPEGKVIRVFLLQCVKQQIYRVLESLVILPDLHSVYHFHQRGKVLLIGGRFIIDVADQRRIEQCFGL